MAQLFIEDGGRDENEWCLEIIIEGMPFFSARRLPRKEAHSLGKLVSQKCGGASVMIWHSKDIQVKAP